MNWGAIGAVATIVAVMVAILQYRHSKKASSSVLAQVNSESNVSKTVAFTRNSILGFFPKDLMEDLRKIGITGSAIYAQEYAFENKSERDLHDVQVIIPTEPTLFSHRINWVRSLSKDAINIDTGPCKLILKLADFPAGEAFKITILENNSGDYIYVESGIKSINGNIKLVPTSEEISEHNFNKR